MMGDPGRSLMVQVAGLELEANSRFLTMEKRKKIDIYPS